LRPERSFARLPPRRAKERGDTIRNVVGEFTLLPNLNAAEIPRQCGLLI
jgi:hypothetical protein